MLYHVSLSDLRSRGGQGFPAFNAARLASRIAIICRACDLVNSRRPGQAAALADGSEIVAHVLLRFLHFNGR
jgi:hypothetical protein